MTYLEIVYFDRRSANENGFLCMFCLLLVSYSIKASIRLSEDILSEENIDFFFSLK